MIGKRILIFIALFTVCHFLTGFANNNSISTKTINIVCNTDNDLYSLLEKSNYDCIRYESVEQAVEKCDNGGILLILANNYPQMKTTLPKNFYELARQKNLKSYVEFPDRLESGKTGSIKMTKKERLVVTSDFFGEALPTMRILDAGLYSYVKVAERISHLKGANVAGFKNAVYGISNTTNFPVLFEEGKVLVSATKMSDFNKSRYSPLKSWEKTINAILNYVSVDIKPVSWEPFVKPTFSKSEPLKENAYRSAIARGAQWYIKGRFLIHPDWKKHWQKIDTLKLPVGPPMDFNLPSGDGSLGIMEGHYSYINHDGSQPYRYWLRADCVAEAAMTFAMANTVSEQRENIEVSNNLMDFLFTSNVFRTPDSKNPRKSSYGLIGWADTHPSVYYGDDNARVILASILAAQNLENNKWNRQIAELILANFRTTGENGFRGGSLTGDKIEKEGWQSLMKNQLQHLAPHFESWLWATYLWLYDKTKYQPLIDKTKKAIQITMDNYPHNWKWTNGLQQERARMILPLAWLVRVEDTDQNRQWLNRICDDLLNFQVSCGALREELGKGSKGKYGSPKSNQHYGTNEAPVIHTNGEPVADMLYTSNFAFFALNEAAQATKNPKYLDAVNRLADFLVRIQSSSKRRADLDGCWFRAFDYENWEYYGSNADHGWGAWGTLTGWTQSFITTTLALKLQETSYWALTKKTSIDREMKTVLPSMLPLLETR